VVALERRARDSPDDLLAERQLGVVRRKLLAVGHERPKAAQHAPSVVLSRNGFLARITALLEVDRTLVEACLGRHHTIVDLSAEARCTRADSHELELLVVDVRLDVEVEELHCRNSEIAGRDAFERPQRDERSVCLGLDLTLQREAGAGQRRPDGRAEARLREHEEVVHPTPEHDERCDHPCFRREQKRLARVAEAERLDVVRDHRLQVSFCVRPSDSHEISRASCDERGGRDRGVHRGRAVDCR